MSMESHNKKDLLLWAQTHQRDRVKGYLRVDGASAVHSVHDDGRLQRGGALGNVLTLVPPVVMW